MDRFNEISIVLENEFNLAVGECTQLNVASNALGDRALAQPERDNQLYKSFVLEICKKLKQIANFLSKQILTKSCAKNDLRPGQVLKDVTGLEANRDGSVERVGR